MVVLGGGVINVVDEYVYAIKVICEYECRCGDHFSFFQCK